MDERDLIWFKGKATLLLWGDNSEIVKIVGPFNFLRTTGPNSRNPFEKHPLLL